MKRLLTCTVFAMATSLAAVAQEPPAAPGTTKMEPSAGRSSATSTGGLTMTETEAKQWIGRKIYSSDNQDVGEVADVKRASDGKVLELHADIGGFLGLGETRVRVMPGQFQVGADRITLNVTGEAAKAFPKVEASAQ